MRRSLAVVFFLGVLAGCDNAAKNPVTQFAGVDITGADYGKALKLTDHTGKVRTLADFKGKVVLVFFGFTHCPEICPMTLHDLGNVMQQLGADAERVQVLFVTLDPARDTQDVLAKFIPAFHPGFIALRGNDAETKTAAQSFHVFFEKRPGATPGSYTIEHFTGTFVFDRDGTLRLLLNYGMGLDKIVHDVKLLLS
jgi:protein SCO1